MRLHWVHAGLGALAAVTASFAAHPLITDDTGTQGKGGFQLEVNAAYDSDREAGITAETTQLAAALSCGMCGSVDLVVGLPYQRHTQTPGSGTAAGLSDLDLELKWRFWEQEGRSLALKPGLTLSTGDHEKDLGGGRAAYHLCLIATEEKGPCTCHANLGYHRNENCRGERVNLGHVSLAPVLEVAQGLDAVANIGLETNPDPGDDTPPGFVLAGLIYVPLENLDLDLGLKAGFTRPAVDYSLLVGTTWRF